MKKLLIILLLGIFCSISAQQGNLQKQQIDSLAQKMFEYTNQKDFSALVDLTYPKIFDILPKEQVVELFKMMFEGNEEFTIEIPELKPDYQLSKIYSNENEDFAFISYDMDMKMTFLNQEFTDEEKELMKPMMEAKNMEVEFISDNSIAATIHNSITIAIKDEHTNKEWTLINYNPDSPIFFQILSSNIIEKAKEYKEELMLQRKKEAEQQTNNSTNDN